MTMRRKLRPLRFLLFCLLCAAAVAGAEQYVVDGVTYKVDGDWVTIAAYPLDQETIIVHGELFGRWVSMDMLDEWQYPTQAKTLEFAEGATDAPMMLLREWTGLERIAIPRSMTSIPLNTMLPVPSLLYYQVHPNNEALKTVDGVLFSKDGTQLLAYPEAKGDHYDVPAGTTVVDWTAFMNNNTIRSITLPEGFVDMSERMFDMNDSLERIEIPSTVSRISAQAFPYGTSLREIVISPDNPWYAVKAGGVYSLADNTLVYYASGYSSSLDIAPGTAAIADNAVRYGAQIESVSIPRGMTELAPGTFAELTSLQAVSLPITLETIGRGAFRECVSLARVALPPHLRTIDAQAFLGCQSLREVHIPDSVAFIDPTAFYATAEDMVVYASEGSAGHALAVSQGFWWAEPGGAPVKLKATRGEAAVVNVAKADDTLALRDAPNEQGAILGHYANGSTLEIIEEAGDWYRVRSGPDTGYMPKASLRKTDALTRLFEPTYMRAEEPDEGGWMKLYTYPSLDAPTLYPYDIMVLRVLDVVGTWYYVEDSSDGRGYLPAEKGTLAREDTGDGRRFCVVSNPRPNDRLNLREAPSTQARALDKLFTATQLEILGEEGDWYHVTTGEMTGYVLKAYTREVVNGEFDSWW